MAYRRLFVNINGQTQPLVRIDSSGNVAWYLTDHLGSIRLLTDNTSAVIDQIDYDAYGNITNETKPTNGDRYKYASGQYNAILGMTLFGARWNDYGHWLSADPTGLEAGPNPYDYVGNDPTNGTDPSGLDPNPIAIQRLNLADYRCAQCHGSLDGGFKNIVSGSESYRWTDLSPEQQNMLLLQSTYRAGVGERVGTRIINGTVGAPVTLLQGLANSTRQGIDEGVPFPIAVAGSPFHLVGSSIQGLGASGYRIVTGDGQAEAYVDVGLAALPFLPKLAKAGKLVPRRFVENPAHSAANYQRLKALYASQEVQGPGRVYQVDYGSTSLSREAFDFRVANDLLESEKNIAVARFRDANGSLETVDAPSRPGKHSEWALDALLKERGIQPPQVIEIYSERQPCRLPGGYCDKFLRENYPNSQITYSIFYEGAADTPELMSAINTLRRALQR